MREFHVVPGLAARVTGEHGYEQVRQASRRQRAGEPAALCTDYAEKLRLAAAREQRKTAEHEAQKLARLHARMAARKRNEGDDHHDNQAK